MHTEDIDLVAYVRGELSKEEAREVEALIASDPALHEEKEALEAMLDHFGKALTPIAAPDPLAFRIMQAVRTEVKQDDEEEQKEVSDAGSASRRLATLRTSSAVKSTERWKSLMVSIALHAAILCLAAGAVVWVGHEHTNEPAHMSVDTTMQQRQQAPRVTRTLIAGVLSIDDIRPADAMYMTDDADGCVWAFPVGGKGNPAEKDFIQQFGAKDQARFIRVATTDGFLRIPEIMQKKTLRDAETIYVISLENHLELWAPKRWDTYKNGVACVNLPTNAVLVAMLSLQ